MVSDQLECQRAAGRVAYHFFEELTKLIKPGLNLLEIEQLAAQRIKEADCQPAFLGYKDYPAVTCLSVNSAIVHGIPYDYRLKNGDVLSVDIGIDNHGWLVDTARTYAVGSISAINKALLDTTQKALQNAIGVCRVGATTGDIGHIIQKTVEGEGFAIVRELTGHGVGPTLQEPPSIPNYGQPGKGSRLNAGMVIAIEPITSIAPVRVVVLSDGWTIAAEQEIVTAHFEHTIVVTDGEPIVLTDG